MSEKITIYLIVSTHSRPKAAGAVGAIPRVRVTFQHTAARRRLAGRELRPRHRPKCFNTQPPEGGWRHRRDSARTRDRFNTQPPEGGWYSILWKVGWNICFNTQPPEGGWIVSARLPNKTHGFNTQPPEGGWLT